MVPKRIASALIVFAFLLGLLPSSFAPASASSPPVSSANPVEADVTAVSAIPRSVAQADPNSTIRVIVGLDAAPLALYAGGVTGLAATSATSTGGAKLDVSAVESQSYLSYLAQRQASFLAAAQAASPSAKAEYNYAITFNGLALSIRAGDFRAIRALPGVVSVTPEREYKQQMDASLPLVGLGTGTIGGTWTDSGLWAAVGGHAKAGAGLKIADVDSGITLDSACFDPTGFTYPTGFPKFGSGFSSFVNPKIIAARAFFRASDPPKNAATPADDPSNDGGGHGDHTAGTMACNYGVQTPFGGLKISGVAPAAQLMVYRVFYKSVSGSESAFDPELMAAAEAVAADGADVVNNSWGGTSLTTVTDDPLVKAYSALVDAGIVVVFSNGNDGPGAMTAGSPGTAPKVISVGASTTSRTLISQLDTVTPVDGPGPLSGRSVATSAVQASAVDLEVAGYVDNIACNGPVPSSIANGKIVVIRRGVCALVDKVANAKAGGAVGVVLRNVTGGSTTLPLINPVLPTVHLSAADGNALRTWLAPLAASQPVQTGVLKINAPATVQYTDAADTIASFSSNGPTPNYGLKPDLAAPGVNILSSVSAPAHFDFYQGTSMAAPHVTGASALLRQLHPSWTPGQIKSALMSTAAEPASLGSDPTVRGAGRIDLSNPQNPGLTFDKPSLSFGLSNVGAIGKQTIIAKDVSGVASTYTISVASSTGDLPTAPASILVSAGGQASFEVAFSATASGDSYGDLKLTNGTHNLHIPYWARAQIPIGSRTVLLIDDDGSGSFAGCTDHRGAYEATLDSLGVSHDAVDTGIGGTIDFGQVARYAKVIYFTGDARCGGTLSFYQNELRNYLSNGGHMLMSGQDIGLLDSQELATFGQSLNPELFFGASYVKDSLYPPATMPKPAAVGESTRSSYLAGVSVDLGPTGDGAKNQTSIDEISAKLYTDVDSLPIFNAPARVSVTGTGSLGTSMASEPTIERTLGTAAWTHLGYRTEYLSFGLEGINNSAGSSTRAEVLDRLLSWLDDSLSVRLVLPPASAPASGLTVAFGAVADSSIGTTKTGFKNQIVGYRWSFGDGSPIVSTTVATASHTYARAGRFVVLVEATDKFGHSAVATGVNGARILLPMIRR